MVSHQDITEKGLTPECCMCKTDMAEFWCDSCNTNYCSNCCEVVHKKKSIFLGHQPIKISDKSYELTQCEIHSDTEIKHWCNDCEEFACDKCLKKEHKNHKNVAIKKAGDEISIKLKNKFEKAQVVLDCSTKYVQQMSDATEAMDTDVVTKCFALLRMMMDEKEKTLKQQILETKARNTGLIKDYQARLKHRTDSLHLNNTHFESIVSANEHIKLLQINEQLTVYLNRFAKELEEIQSSIKPEYQIKGLDQLETSVDDSLKQTFIVEKTQESVKSDQSSSPPIDKGDCGGGRCTTCNKCADWKWNKQKKKWDRAPNAQCVYLTLPKYHALLPWHYLCHGH